MLQHTILRPRDLRRGLPLSDPDPELASTAPISCALAI